MINHPIVNAFAAIIYIVILVLTLENLIIPVQPPEAMAPIIMLSLFVLSAAVMGYLFLAQPIHLYLDGKKKEAVNFFLQTVGVFAGITVFILAVTIFVSSGKALS